MIKYTIHFIFYFSLGLVNQIYAMQEYTARTKRPYERAFIVNPNPALMDSSPASPEIQQGTGKVLKEVRPNVTTTKPYEVKKFSLHKPPSQQKEIAKAITVISGPHTTRGYTKAFDMLSVIAAQAHDLHDRADAYFWLGYIYYEGLGTFRDLDHAIFNFSHASALAKDTASQNRAMKFLTIATILKTIEESNNVNFATIAIRQSIDKFPPLQSDSHAIEFILQKLKQKFPEINSVDTILSIVPTHSFAMIQHLLASSPALKATILKEFSRKDLRSYLNDLFIAAIVKNSNAIELQELFNAGADINFVDTNGNNPLMIAISKRNIGLVNWLLAHGANPLQIISHPEWGAVTPQAFAQQDPQNQAIALIIENYIASHFQIPVSASQGHKKAPSSGE